MVKKKKISIFIPLFLLLMGSGFAYFLISQLEERTIALQESNAALMDTLNATPIYDKTMVPEEKTTKKRAFIKSSQEAFNIMENLGQLKPIRTILCEKGGLKKSNAIVLESDGTFYLWEQKSKLYGKIAEPPSSIGKYMLQEPFVLISIYAKSISEDAFEPTAFRALISSVSNNGYIQSLTVGSQNFERRHCPLKVRRNFRTAPIGTRNPRLYRKNYANTDQLFDDEISEHRKEVKAFKKKHNLGRRRWQKDEQGRIMKQYPEENPEAFKRWRHRGQEDVPEDQLDEPKVEAQ